MSDDVTASVTVYVNVIDVNDHAPQFSGVAPLVATISEDGEVGSSVVTVSATDQDSGKEACLLNVWFSLPCLSQMYIGD